MFTANDCFIGAKLFGLALLLRGCEGNDIPTRNLSTCCAEVLEELEDGIFPRLFRIVNM